VIAHLLLRSGAIVFAYACSFFVPGAQNKVNWLPNTNLSWKVGHFYRGAHRICASRKFRSLLPDASRIERFIESKLISAIVNPDINAAKICVKQTNNHDLKIFSCEIFRNVFVNFS
jgi:hypothetical protein